MLIISTVKEVPDTKPHTIARSIYVIPGIFCAFILAGAGVEVGTQTYVTNSTVIALNSSEVWTEDITQTTYFTLEDPIWVTVHYLIGIILMVYVIQQLLILFTRV